MKRILLWVISSIIIANIQLKGCEIDDLILSNFKWDAKILALNEVGQDSLYGDSIELPANLIKKYLLAFNSVLNSGYSCVDSIFKSNYPIHEFGNWGTLLAIDIPVNESWLQNIQIGTMPDLDSPIFDYVSPYNYVINKLDTIASTGFVRLILKTDSLINENALSILISDELYYSSEVLYWNKAIYDGFSKPDDWDKLDTIAHTTIIVNYDLETITFGRSLIDSLSNYPLGNQFYEFSFDTTCNAKLLRTHYADYTTEASQTVFPTDSAIWNNEGDTWLGNHRFGICGDTIIESKTYSKIYILRDTTLNTQPEDYIGGLREADKKIFVRMLNTPEFVLYDFNLSESDTMRYNYMSYTGDPKDLVQEDYFMVVKSIGTETIYNGESRRSIQFETKKWIEGIGSTLGCALFDPIMDYPLNGKTYSIACLKYKDDILFLNPLKCQECFCTIKTHVNEPGDASELHDIFPNPTSGKLQVKTGNFTSYQVFSLNGKVVLHGVLNARVIDISSLPRGIYLLKLADINGSLVPYKIVKN